jgi:DNA adenine methylase
VEPFIGAGSLFSAVMHRHDAPATAWINDVDPTVVSVWTAVRDYPEMLVKATLREQPNAASYEAYRKQLKGVIEVPSSSEAIVNVALMKLVVQQCSFSGRGTKSGAKGNILERWNAQRLAERIRNVPIRDTKITCMSYAEILENFLPRSFLMLDPPYVRHGPANYECSFQLDEHVQLAKLLQRTQHDFYLTYDDHPLIRDLYAWAVVEEVHASHSATTHGKVRELWIRPRREEADGREKQFSTPPASKQTAVTRMRVALNKRRRTVAATSYTQIEEP